MRSNTDLLKMGKPNAKLIELQRYLSELAGRRIRLQTYSTSAGLSCVGAKDCHAWVVENKKTGKRELIDGPNQLFGCFAANQELQYKQTFEARRHNLALINRAKTAENIADLIVRSWGRADVTRWGVSGDFHTVEYMRGLYLAMRELGPERRAYFYTKSIPFLLELAAERPANVAVTASMGSKYDALAYEHGIRRCTVYGSPEAAAADGAPLDHDDRHAAAENFGGFKGMGGEHFGLLVHGIQRPGTWGAEQLVQLRKRGIRSGYSRKRALA